MCKEERLERYDRLYADLLAEKDRIVSKMSVLRAEDKTRTATYHQLMADKLTVQTMLGRFEVYGIDAPEK
ncbi:MAG: hypothetical protein LKJ86_08755 [Oscillibacter sp.]|jgi:hypothetical protein|nr:hypothetical protein [Oscillibacter sp.]